MLSNPFFLSSCIEMEAYFFVLEHVNQFHDNIKLVPEKDRFCLRTMVVYLAFIKSYTQRPSHHSSVMKYSSVKSPPRSSTDS